MFRRRRARALSGIAAACLAVLPAASAVAGARIVNGLETQDFPTTGGLLYSMGNFPIDADNASLWCSGTLIGCSTFLTAAHCVVDDTAVSHYQVYLQHGGIKAVSSITYNPAYDGASGVDVAIMKLATPVTGVDPTPFNTSHDLDALGVGFDGVIAGFGQTAGGANDYGIKRYGDIVTADCIPGETNGEGNDVLVCWDYADPVGPAGSDSNTCSGDSGGPLFMTFAGTIEVVGVTSAGSATNCQPTDHSWDGSVYHNRVWIGGQLGADSTATCGGIAPVGDPSTAMQTDSELLSSANPDDSITVTLTGTPTLARFTLNGTDNGLFNPNFFVKQGAGASNTDYDCKADGASVFGACDFLNPAAGMWSVFVQRASGTGRYQVTTTVFGGDPSVCGNNVAELGEDCDGSDLGSCPIGPCSACSCPAPVCGNDVVESGEACDGSDDGACPGACENGCTCPNTCSSGDLYGLSFVADARRLSYKALVYDPSAAYADLDPTAADLALDVSDLDSSVSLAIPAEDSRWAKADPVHRRYAWRDAGTTGLRRVRLMYKDASPTAYWKVLVKGKDVPGADSLDLTAVLAFRLDFGGTCHLESW